MNDKEFRKFGKELHEACEYLMLVMHSKGMQDYSEYL